MKYSLSADQGVYVIFLVLLLWLGGSFVYLANEAEQPRKERAAEQLVLDTLYRALIGDTASVQSGLKRYNKAMKSLCVELSIRQGIHPSHCEGKE